MKTLTGTALYFGRNMRYTLRQPAFVFMGFMTPILYILLFSPLLKNLAQPALSTGQVLDNFVPGLLSLIAFGAGMGAGWSLVDQIKTGLLERLQVSPASRFSQMLGGVLVNVVVFLVQALVVVIVSAFFGFKLHLSGLILLLLLLSFLTAIVSAWSACIGIIFKEIGSVASIVTGLQLPLTLLSGILLPMSLAPDWLKTLAHVNPMYYAVQASSSLAAGTLSSSAVAQGFTIIGILTVLVLTWATHVYRKAVS